eukprot:5999282-Ditylum_brightwellii.AAC.1
MKEETTEIWNMLTALMCKFDGGVVTTRSVDTPGKQKRLYLKTGTSNNQHNNQVAVSPEPQADAASVGGAQQ